MGTEYFLDWTKSNCKIFSFRFSFCIIHLCLPFGIWSAHLFRWNFQIFVLSWRKIELQIEVIQTLRHNLQWSSSNHKYKIGVSIQKCSRIWRLMSYRFLFGVEPFSKVTIGDCFFFVVLFFYYLIRKNRDKMHILW